MSKTFDECYFSKDQTNISVVEIVDNEEKYQHFIFCPECKKARLSFIPETPVVRNGKQYIRKAYLKAIDIKEHNDDCSYIYDYEKSTKVKEYFKTLTEQQVESKINSIMKMLCKTPLEADAQETISKNIENNPMLIRHKTQQNTQTYRSLRRKSLDGYLEFGEDEKDEIFAFYAEAKLELEEKHGKNGIFYILKIKTKNRNGEWKKKVSLTRNAKLEIDTNAVYRIVLIGVLDTKYMSVKLVRYNAIQFEIIKH